MAVDPDAAIHAALAPIAPEANLESLAADDDLRECLDLDSMDFLEFLIALARVTGVEIPERDYVLVRTLGGLRAYLAERAGTL